jgi:uncharacterized membrane protein
VTFQSLLLEGLQNAQSDKAWLRQELEAAQQERDELAQRAQQGGRRPAG